MQEKQIDEIIAHLKQLGNHTAAGLIEKYKNDEQWVRELMRVFMYSIENGVITRPSPAKRSNKEIEESK